MSEGAWGSGQPGERGRGRSRNPLVSADWRDVGGQNATIVPYSRENNSGTYVFFKEHVLENEDFAREIQTLPNRLMREACK